MAATAYPARGRAMGFDVLRGNARLLRRGPGLHSGGGAPPKIKCNVDAFYAFNVIRRSVYLGV